MRSKKVLRLSVKDYQKIMDTPKGGPPPVACDHEEGHHKGGIYSCRWSAKNEDKIKARNKQRVSEMKALTGDSYNRGRYLMQTYGITEGDYLKFLKAQGGVCALCGKKPGRIRLAIDHDHTIKKRTGVIVIRGLLHSRCNHNLGSIEHSDEAIRRTIIYLQKILDLRAKYDKEGA